MAPGSGRCNGSTVIGRSVNQLVRANRKRRVASVTTMLWLLAVVSIKLCPAVFFSFLSTARRDKGGGPFPHVCRLCQLNSDAILATVSIYYVIPSTGSGMISVLLQVASMTSLHMRHQA